MEVAILEPSFGTIERFVGVPPGVVGGVRMPAGASHRDSRRQRSPRAVHGNHAQRADRLVVAPLGGHHRLLAAADDVDHPERCVAAFVRDVGDAMPIARPARCRCVEVAVSQGEGIAALARHQPELIPLAAEVRAVHDPRPVGRPVRSGLPRGLLVAQLAQRRAPPGACVHPPESARAVDVASVRDEDDLFAIGRPGRRDVVVPFAVVVARQLAVVVLGNP